MAHSKFKECGHRTGKLKEQSRNPGQYQIRCLYSLSKWTWGGRVLETQKETLRKITERINDQISREEPNPGYLMN